MPEMMDYSNENDWMGACVPKMMDEGKEHDQAVAACMSMWREKKSLGGMTIEAAVKYFIEREAKLGARNSRRDQERLQVMHDYSVENGAICKKGKALGLDEVLIADGSSVKALPGGKVGGYLVRFSTENDPDLTGEYFTAETDFGDAEKSPVLFHHGLDDKMGRRKIGSGELKPDEVGVWIEAQLNLRDEYEKAIYEMADKGKLGWSSGTAAHLVDRDQTGKILSWPLGLDASLTPTPAEPRNGAVPLKSLIAPETDMAGKDDQKSTTQKTEARASKENEMDEKDVKAILDERETAQAAQLESMASSAATKAVEGWLEKLPELKAKLGAQVEIVKDEADQPFKTKGEFFIAVKNAALFPGQMDKRLLPLKATGLSEAQPSQAGFLVPQLTAPGIIEAMYGTGTLLSFFTNRVPVSGNNMSFNIVAETSRADGSRHGGLTGYWGAEAGTKTASKPAFRQLELKLNKVYALCVATDELLEDAPALEGWLNRTVPDELRFKVEDAIVNGDGVGKPLGLMASPALQAAVRTDANEIDPLDIGRMWALRYAGVNDYIWLVSQGTFPQLLNMTIGNMPVFLPAGGLGGLPYGQLLGRPVIETEYNAALGTVGDIILVSPSQYQMIEKAGGIQAASSIHVYFTTDESAFRFVYRVGGAPIWSSGVTGKDSVVRSPIVDLAATT